LIEGLLAWPLSLADGCHLSFDLRSMALACILTTGSSVLHTTGPSGGSSWFTFFVSRPTAADSCPPSHNTHTMLLAVPCTAPCPRKPCKRNPLHSAEIALTPSPPFSLHLEPSPIAFIYYTCKKRKSIVQSLINDAKDEFDSSDDDMKPFDPVGGVVIPILRGHGCCFWRLGCEWVVPSSAALNAAWQGVAAIVA